MAGKRSFGNPVPVSDLAGGILDPMLRRRTGMSLALVQSWEEIAGPRLAARSRPQKIQWPRRLHEDDPFEPATLVIACEGMAALHLQHETGEIIGRSTPSSASPLSPHPHRAEAGGPRECAGAAGAAAAFGAREARLSGTVAGIETTDLRASLERLAPPSSARASSGLRHARPARQTGMPGLRRKSRALVIAAGQLYIGLGATMA